MASSTPIARSKTAALSRVTDSIPKGYDRYISGQVKVEKAEKLLRKFSEIHKIGISPAARIVRKKSGKANALLCIFWPEDAKMVEWCLLFTLGELNAPEQLKDVGGKSRLQWLGYELIRHSSRGKACWTWRRPKGEMAEHYAFLAEKMNRRHQGEVKDALQRIANQPGFAGVREQSWALCQFAFSKGYSEPLPHIFFLQKVSHGERFIL